ncbi:hypothetical protein EIP86_001304 [Pleurotus ostreatoroseus]|nr:hypothetical protein EIP86_001304 [Pleurotus ostreatoroseus]
MTANLLRLIRRTLSILPNLQWLQLNFSSYDNDSRSSWVLADFTTPLVKFFTTFDFDPALAHFLEAQSSLQVLSLQWCAGNAPMETLTLSPSALPHLEVFSYNGFWLTDEALQVMRTVITGRPVKDVDICLIGGSNTYSIVADAIAGGSCPLQRLMFVDVADDTQMDLLVQTIAARFPMLEALEIGADLDTLDDFLSVAVPLGNMRKLKTMGFDAEELKLDFEAKRQVVEAYGKACPSLRAVCLGKDRWQIYSSNHGLSVRMEVDLSSATLAMPEVKSAVDIVLGCMTFGKEGNEGARLHTVKDVEAIFDVFQAHGHTEIDTARVYCGGTAEGLIGQLDLKGRGIKVETKLAPRTSEGVAVKITHSPEVRTDLRKFLDVSLKELQVE